MIYFTSDLHFGHTNIIGYENRPFKSVREMDKALVDNWNSKVKSDSDEVYVLGDVSFHHDKEVTKKLLEQLRGKKYLILGNHDKDILRDNDLRKHFEWVRDYYVLRADGHKIILFHYPIQVWDCKHHNSIHLYGHIHLQSINHHGGVEMPNAINVGVDCNNYAPLSLEEVVARCEV